MRRRIPVSEIMTTNVITLNVSDAIEDAKLIFEDKSIRHIPIVKDKKVIGMLSSNDILKIAYADLSENDKDVDVSIFDWFTIEQVMTKSLYVVTPETSIEDVGIIFSENEFHALPIVEDGELVGIVTTTDLIKFLVNLF
jgi:CBS domain-containing protein